MSKSLKRVVAALNDAQITVNMLEMDADTRTAQQAADAAGCALDQILKSIIFLGEESQRAILFMTAGGNQVDPHKASRLAGEKLGKADAALIRAQTGFAIGGVAPIGHLTPVRSFLDPRLLDFPLIWAAGGTPRHIFQIDPNVFQNIFDTQIADFTV